MVSALACFPTLILVLLGFSSCKEEESRGLTGVDYHFINRTGDYMWADNLSVQKEIIDLVGKVTEKTNYNALPNNASFKLADYALYINTCNAGYDKTRLEPSEYKDENFSPYKLPVQRLLQDENALEPDPIIVNQLRQHFDKGPSGLRSNGGFYVILYVIEYRTTPIKSISVYFSEDLLGVKNGEPLNHLLNASLYSRESSPFIITGAKKVIWSTEKVFPLAKYLAYNPMAPTELVMRFREGVKLTEPVTGKFTVTMEPVSGKLITATTKTITLTP